MARTYLVVTSAACLSLAGCTQAPQTPPELPTAKLCSFQSSGFAYAGGPSPRPDTISMNNDGGWCGHLNVSTHGSLVFGEQMHLVQPPRHGQVSITVLQNGTQILYRPSPNFAGSDSFSVRDDMFNITLPYDVIIVAG